MNSNKNKNKNNNKNKNKNKNKNISQLFKLISEKKIFLALIFINLIFQHYISYYVSANSNLDTPKEKEKEEDTDTTKFKTIIIVSAYILATLFVILLIFFPMSMMFKFIIFSLFSVTYGIIYVSLKRSFDPNIIKGAALGTLIVFVFMILYGLALTMSGIHVTNKVAFGIFYALLLLIIVGAVQYFIYNYSVITKLVLIILSSLFALYIVHTTNNILLRNYEGDFITASFDYYIDMSNFFRALKVDNN
jgi:FtsH-binding integral membrane protein